MPLSGESNPPNVVLFVHGTFSYDDREGVEPSIDQVERRGSWWQRGSSFAARLDELLNNSAEITPKGRESITILPWWVSVFPWLQAREPQAPVLQAGSTNSIPPAHESVFHWSGDNSESGRRLAGALLLRHLQQFAGSRVHVVAHSHGGTALWEALRLAATGRVKRPVFRLHKDKPTVNLLPNLASWTTVATPYLSFKPDWWAARVAVLPLLALIALTYRRYLPWLEEFWIQMAPGVAWPPLAIAFGFLGFLAACFLPSALLLKLAWASYRSQKAREVGLRPGSVDQPEADINPGLGLEWQRREHNEVMSVLMALIVAMPISLLTVFLLAPPIFRTTEFWAKTGLVSLLATAWMVTLITTCLAFVFRIAGFFWAWADCAWTRSADNEAWNAFREIGLVYAYDERDEAIRGLAALRRQPAKTLLPRAPQPGRDFFSSRYRHPLRPEREISHQSVIAWAFDNLLLPLVIFKDWVVNPIYNTVFAGFIDQYVLGQLRRRALGLDIPSLELEDVTPHPITGQRPRISAEASEDIDRMTKAHEGDFIDRIRINLLVDHPAAVSLDELVKKEFTGDKGATGALVHNRYFDSEVFAKDVAEFMKDKKTVLEQAAPPRSARPSIIDRRPTQSDFLQKSIWFLMTVALAGWPVLAVELFGRYTVYPYSLSYQLATWAGDEQLAADSTIRDNLAALPYWGNTDGHTPEEAPLVVRWWLLNDIVLGRDPLAWLESIRPNGGIEGPPESLERYQAQKVVFLSKLGQKHAELLDHDKATQYFRRAAAEIALISNEANRDNAYKVLWVCLGVARSHLGEDRYVTILAEISKDAIGVLKKLDGDKKLTPFWKEERRDFERNAGLSKPLNVLKWCNEDPRPKCVLKRAAYILRNRKPPVPVMSASDVNDLIGTFNEAASKLALPDQKDGLLHVLLILGVAEHVPGEFRALLLATASKICDRESARNPNSAKHGRGAIAMTLRPWFDAAILQTVKSQFAGSADAAFLAGAGDYAYAAELVHTATPEKRMEVAVAMLLRASVRPDITQLREAVGDLIPRMAVK